jgi:hypothetical protein
VTAGWPLIRKFRKKARLLVNAILAALNTADMYIRAGVNASDK